MERGLEKRGESVCVECWVHIYIHNCRTTFIENIYHLVSCSCHEGGKIEKTKQAKWVCMHLD